MAKGQKRSAKEAKKPKANKPKTSVSDYKKSVTRSERPFAGQGSGTARSWPQANA